MKLGFQFTETMAGTFTRVGNRPGVEESGSIRFTGKAVADSAIKHLRDGRTRLEGTLDMEGFADDVPIRGWLEIRPVLRKIIRYDFDFLGNDGNPYRFAGQKDIRFMALRETWTTLHGAVLDGRGEEVAKATLHFDVKGELLPFLVSFKPVTA
jgi:hypothetical protein